MDNIDKVVDYINVQRDRYVDELKQYLAIPSISALPQHQADVRRAAEWSADHMKGIGLENVRLFETPGNPIVYGEWLNAPGAPTILFYGHYDVQPVDPVELWESPPFEATVRENEIYARGAADDKGQVFMHFKAIEAHMKQAGRLPLNIKVFLEGEEEVGSLHLDEFVRQNKPLLAADVVVISDSAMFAREIPSICYGLRGLVYYQIDLRGTKSDLHSGVFGGAMANPAFVLSQMLVADERQERSREDRRLLRRRAGSHRGGTGGMEEAAVRREEIPQGMGRAEARRRVGLHACSSGCGAGRRSKSTGCCRALPAKGRRPCCRPSRWRRSACGSCRTRTPTRLRNSSRSTSGRSRRRPSSSS